MRRARPFRRAVAACAGPLALALAFALGSASASLGQQAQFEVLYAGEDWSTTRLGAGSPEETCTMRVEGRGGSWLSLNAGILDSDYFILGNPGWTFPAEPEPENLVMGFDTFVPFAIYGSRSSNTILFFLPDAPEEARAFQAQLFNAARITLRRLAPEERYIFSTRSLRAALDAWATCAEGLPER